MNILAIDPGPAESAYVVIDHASREPIEFGKLGNDELLGALPNGLSAPVDAAAIEMIESFGMAVGREVFSTCVWVGRFQQRLHHFAPHLPVSLVHRGAVKMHHCHSRAAKDPNTIQALVDRFTPGQPNKGKGTKAEPGWFYGFAGDVWQAYALAVYVADTAARPPAEVAP